MDGNTGTSITLPFNIHEKASSTFSSVQFSHSAMSDSLQPHESQHARPPCPTPTKHHCITVLQSFKLRNNFNTLFKWIPIHSTLGNAKVKKVIITFILLLWINTYILQFSSVAQLCPTLCGPMNRSMPSFPVNHQLLEFTQIYVHRVGDAIQPSHPLSSPFPPAPNPSQHQSLFQWVNSSHEVAKVLEFQLQHHSSQRTPRDDLL